MPDPREKNRPPLPFTDTKPVGAADFFFAINATFRFIERRLGAGGLRRYWTDLGRLYFQPVSENWSQGGLPAVAAYWRAFFAAEPCAEVVVTEGSAEVTVEVKTCPAILHLRRGGREIHPSFCQHCYFQEEAMAAAAGLAMRLEGGNGSCLHTFCHRRPGLPDQDLSAIREASC